MGPSCSTARLSLLPAYPRPNAVCLHPSHAPFTEEDLVLGPALSDQAHATIRGTYAPLPQGSSAPVRVMLSRSLSAYTTPSASLTGTLRLRGIALIRSAFAVRERLGDRRDLPYFRCCSFPYVPSTLPPAGPLSLLVVLEQRFQASSIFERVATHNARLCQQYPTG